MNVFAKFDEISSMILQDIKETKRYGHTVCRGYKNLISVPQCLVPTVTENVPTVTVVSWHFISKQQVGIACKNDLFHSILL